MICRHCGKDFTPEKDDACVCPHCGKAQFSQKTESSSAPAKAHDALWIVGIALCVAAILGAANDFPGFIRQIPGAKFVGGWAGWSLLAIGAALLLELVICSVCASNMANKAKKLVFSDSDLMIIQDFDRFKLAGYYLLKAKLHNVITYSSAVSDDGTPSKDVLVEINPNASEEDVIRYCENNPQVRRIVEFINSSKGLEGAQVTVADIVYNVRPEPVIQSAGGEYSRKAINRLKAIADGIFWSTAALSGYVAVAKLTMGICNDKPVNNLLMAMVLAVPVMLLIHLLHRRIKNSAVKNGFVETVIRQKSVGYEKIGMVFDLATFPNTGLSPEKAATILRGYALYRYDPNKYPASKATAQFSGAIFCSVVAAQAAAAAARAARNSGHGCSGAYGCSSCSSCGGGCGGCGGCGGD